MKVDLIVDTILKVLVEELIKHEPEIQTFIQDELSALGKILTDYLSEKMDIKRD